MTQNLSIDSDRLWASIIETAAFGATAKGGIRRLALSAEDAQVRAWFRSACEAIGCTLQVDSMGSMFARRAGRNPNLPPIAIGSHLDTQPTGGKFDGVIGVLAGLEVLRRLHGAGIETEAPIELINWTNEEGARFAPAMLASGTFAGVFTEEYGHSRTDRDGIRFDTAMDAIAARHISNCISSRGRFWRKRAAPSVWSAACSRSAGMKPLSPAPTATQEPRRCGCGAMRCWGRRGSSKPSTASPAPMRRMRWAQWG